MLKCKVSKRKFSKQGLYLTLEAVSNYPRELAVDCPEDHGVRLQPLTAHCCRCCQEGRLAYEVAMNLGLCLALKEVRHINTVTVVILLMILPEKRK